jgi:hypothetical protein
MMEQNHLSEQYAPAEIFQILNEQHRLCSPLDPMADATFELRPDTCIADWQDAQDLLPWHKLAHFYNQLFRIQVAMKDWKAVMCPEEERTLWDVCVLIAQHTRREGIHPVKRLGSDCLTAAVFLRLKQNLGQKGVAVKGLKPSSALSPYLNQHFSPMVEEIILFGEGILPHLRFKHSFRKRVFTSWLNWLFPKYHWEAEFDTGEVVTFRDLTQRIIAVKFPQ